MKERATVVDSTGKRHRARIAGDRQHVTIERCPSCNTEPCDVRGTGITNHDYDTYYAPAKALCCDQPIGTIELKVDTFFGIEEDEAVLVHGRCRVYGGES